MSECKHGLKHGCAYCHASTSVPTRATAVGQAKRRTKTSRLAEQMNERATKLKQRLRELRGE